MTYARNQDTPIHPVIGKLSALITCKLEDAHRLSISGHRPTNIEDTLQEVNQINAMAGEITVLCEAVEAMLSDCAS
ncbi:hypothetical protein [Parasphingorhabdus marina]|uniref:hypothetical protein n=1 Tax=Parasphingorhabdus marina TaxID=394732 RepID=UPI0009409EE6|nr:hypothetical protein [Parasphingorhabdus marina]